MGAYKKLAVICTGIALVLTLASAAFAALPTTAEQQHKIDADAKDRQAAQDLAMQTCRSLPPSAGPVPAWVLSLCGHQGTVDAQTSLVPEASAGPILMQEATSNTVRFATIAGIATTTSFGALVPTSATDFPADFELLPTDGARVYQLTTTGAVSRYSTTGVNTVLAPIPPPAGSTWSDMAQDPITGNTYAASVVCGTSSALNIVNLTLGTSVAVGPITNSTCLIGLAADNTGQLYGYDIVSDMLIRIDKTTGAGVVVGPIGFDASFGQSMDCDPASGTCYLFAFNNTSFQAELRSVNLTTGATTLVGAIGTTSPGGTVQVAGGVFGTIQDSCNNNADCQDGNLCNGIETCVANLCVPGTPVNCDDTQFCTIDGCTPATGACTHAPNTCDDQNPCTTDTCDNGTGCHNVAGACQQFCANVSTAIPSSGTSTPYPTPIVVAGLGPIASLSSVVLQGLSHTYPDDIDMLLQGPTGPNLIIMSDVGGSNGVTNITLTLADSAATSMPDSTALATGTYKPTNIGAGDTFAAPAPAPSASTTLSIFNGLNPNGTWKLFVVDDLGGDSGTLTNWCVNITVAACAQNSDCNDNNPCTDDACINTSCTHVNNSNACDDASLCTSNDVCSNGVCGGTPQNCDDGNACTVDGCTPGTGQCTHGPIDCSDTDPCTFDYCVQGPGCQHSANQCVEICNNTGIALTDSATPPTTANPYPSQITVSGQSGIFSLAAVKLNGLSHTFPDDLDMLVVGPGGQNSIIMSDAGGGGDITNVNLTLSDAAAASLPDAGPLVTGTFKPTNVSDGTDTWPAPAPAPAGTSVLSVFNGTNPNGTWKLFSVDDANIDSGTLAGWCVDLLLGCQVNADCDDADPCTTDTCNGTLCQHALVGGPGLVTGDAFPTKTTMTWDATPGATSYDVVRGLTSALPVGPGGGDEVCLGPVATNSVGDASAPATASAYYYVVRAKNACGGAGSYGTQSNLTARVTTTCP